MTRPSKRLSLLSGGEPGVGLGGGPPEWCLYALVGIFEQRDVANLRADGLHHLLTVGTGEADGRSFADTRGERNGLRPAIYQHLGAGDGALAGTASAAHEADDLALPEPFEASLAFGRRDEIRRAGA